MQKTPLLQPSTFGAGQPFRESKTQIVQRISVQSKTEDEEHLHKALLLIGDKEAKIKQDVRDLDNKNSKELDEIVNYLFYFYDALACESIHLDYGSVIETHNKDLRLTRKPIILTHYQFEVIVRFLRIDDLVISRYTLYKLPIEEPKSKFTFTDSKHRY